jgi:hypothetical protein
LKKYKSQQECVSETVKLFEDPTYSDDSPEKTDAVMKLMNKVSPNARLVLIFSRFSPDDRCKRWDHHLQRLWVTYLPVL